MHLIYIEHLVNADFCKLKVPVRFGLLSPAFLGQKFMN